MRDLIFIMVFAIAVSLSWSGQAQNQGFQIKSFTVEDKAATLLIETIGNKIPLTGAVDHHFRLASVDQRILADCDHIGVNLECDIRYDGSSDGLLALFAPRNNKGFKLTNHTVRSSGERSIADLLEVLRKFGLPAPESFRRLNEAVAMSDTVDQVIAHLKSPGTALATDQSTDQPTGGGPLADGNIGKGPPPYDGCPNSGGAAAFGEYRFTAGGGCRGGGPPPALLGPPIVMVPGPPPQRRPAPLNFAW